MIIVGEQLNSSRKSVFEAFQKKDEKLLLEVARKQTEAGADYLDLNVAAFEEREIDLLRWIIPVLQDSLVIPLSIDSPNPAALEAALTIHRGRALLNSLPGGVEMNKKLLPLIRVFKPRVICLCLDDSGPSRTVESVLRLAGAAVDRLVQAGLACEDIFIDPGVYPLAVDPQGATLFLGALEKIKHHLRGVQTIAGLSNVSFGLPQRRLLNRTLLVMAMERGLDAVICDPCDGELRAALVSARAIRGQDLFLQNYLKSVRENFSIKPK
jgi:cobalamin-dependent methionine synthase I